MNRIAKVSNEVFLMLTGTMTPVIWFIEKYIYADWPFIVSLFVLIALDTVLSFYIHIRSGTVSSNGFAKLFTKVIIYMVFLIVIHTATNLKANGDPVGILSWVDSVGYSAIVVREFISILEKCIKINPNIIPVWILDRLKKYDKSGE